MTPEQIVLTAHDGFVKAEVTLPDSRRGGFAYPSSIRATDDLDAEGFDGVTRREMYIAQARQDIAALWGDDDR